MADPCLYPLFAQMLEHSLRKCYRAMLAARAAERYDKLALSLMQIKRDKKIYEIGKLCKQLLRLFKRQHIIAYAAFKSRMLFQIGNIIRIRQASYVKYKIRITAVAIFESE